MFRPTKQLLKQRAITVRFGQRRVLKNPILATEYIRRAVETGVYRSPSEIDKMLKERKAQEDPIADVMKRFRQDIVRGASIHDYPDEYLILRQNPPTPAVPLIPVRERKKAERIAIKAGLEPAHPMLSLTKQYLHRHELVDVHGRNPNEYPNGAPLTGEEYYRRLLGVPKPPDTKYSQLGKKAAPIQMAYTAALKHYELVRTQGLSDEEAMKRVDELLKQERQDEYKQAAAVLAKAQELRQSKEGDDSSIGPNATMLDLAQDHEKAKGGVPWPSVLKGGRKDLILAEQREEILQKRSLRSKLQPPSKTGFENVFHNILGSEPRVLEAMMKWSRRLEAIPYAQWTVGASTALDHWIARQVLGYSEATWQILLEGNDPDYMAHGEKLMEAREALFPETILDGTQPEDHDTSPFYSDTKKEDSSTSSSLADYKQDSVRPTSEINPDKSLEALLFSLGELGADDGNKSAKNQSWTTKETAASTAETLENLDDRISKIVQQMQDWRREHHEKAPFEEWPEQRKRELDEWIKNHYIPAFASTSEQFNRKLDLEATRQAILSPPPVSAQDSDHFWSSLSNEQDATTLLEQMKRDGPPAGISVLHQSFWDLDYGQQLQQLLNLGAIRPLLDEYANETDRRAFISKYADVLMTGVPLEYLIPDPNGSIIAQDLPQPLARDMGLRMTSRGLSTDGEIRYRLERIPYRGGTPKSPGSGDSDNIDWEYSRALYRAWNQHKANRARYEEEMFQTNRIGLTYDNPPKSDGDPDYYFEVFPNEKPEDYEKEKEKRQKLLQKIQKKKAAAAAAREERDARSSRKY